MVMQLQVLRTSLGLQLPGILLGLVVDLQKILKAKRLLPVTAQRGQKNEMERQGSHCCT